MFGVVHNLHKLPCLTHSMIAEIYKIFKKKQTIEGAGVKLYRVFGHREVEECDPFLLLDHFGSKNPADYLKGFPWHPHRGIETVTYMLKGEVEHSDSLGNKGVIASGDVQWMTAGSGIIHQEMPRAYDGKMEGFQLWINLSKENKMTQPKYREIKNQNIPVVATDDFSMKVISGSFRETKGPTELPIDYFDVTLTGEIRIPKHYNAFIYIISGSVLVRNMEVFDGNCILFGKGEEIEVKSKSAQFLFVSGKQLNEPISWGGPIVMNTDEELKKAFLELDEGTFVKHS